MTDRDRQPRDADPRPDALDADLAAATRARDRLLARATFWDHWRGRLLLPLILLGGGAGAALGYALRRALRWPDRTDAVGAVIAILLVGRFVTSYFDVRRLSVAERRVADLLRRRTARDERTARARR